VSRVAVLKGGRSLERQVSLASGARVEDALERLGHEVVGIDVGGDLFTALHDCAPDVAFIAMHGPGGEDGTVQELLEVLGIPYTGSGVSASARCADKVLAKHALRDAGLPTPDWVAFTDTAFRDLGAGQALDAIEQRLDFPLVVKPVGQGSAIGIKFARSAQEVPAAILAAFSYDPKVMIERFVAGRELAAGVLSGRAGGAQALPIVEAIARDALRLPGRSRRGARSARPGGRTRCLRAARLLRLRARRHDPRGRRPADPRAQHDPGPHGDEHAATGRRRSRDRL
jgi:D-alanine-D-alanine ligase